MSDARQQIEATLASTSSEIAKMSDADLLERCNRLLPSAVQATDLAGAANALVAVAMFAVHLSTEIESRK